MNTFRKAESTPMKFVYGVGIVILMIVIAILVFGIRVELFADSSHAEKEQTSSVIRSYRTVQDVLTMFGEYNVDVTLVNSMENVPFVEESLEVTINVDGQPVDAYVHTFSDSETMDAWLDMSQGLDGVAVYRGIELWAISVDSDLPNSRDLGEQLANTLNGDVSS